MARLVVLDGYTLSPGDLTWDPLAVLGELTVFDRTPKELVLERSLDAEVLVTNKTAIDESTLRALPRLRGISVLATGVNVVDVSVARELGIPVCNVPRYSTASVAEHTFALLFELCRHVGGHGALVRGGAWTQSPDFSFWREPLVELDGLTLGIVGFGAIGSRVARIGSALGMRVLATPSRANPEPGDVRTRTLEQVFSESDVVTLHCPLTPETGHMVRRERLRTMKRSSLLINTARGGLIDEPALAHALAAGTVAGAGLDVLALEPPPPDHPLLHAPHCLITPHNAWTSRAARERLLGATVENVAAILAGKPINVVDG
jgi:glycerate dehydrogenase